MYIGGDKSFTSTCDGIDFRHVAKSKNLGGQVVMGGDNVPPLVEIGLSDPPKSGGAAAPPHSACLEVKVAVLSIFSKFG